MSQELRRNRLHSPSRLPALAAVVLTGLVTTAVAGYAVDEPVASYRLEIRELSPSPRLWVEAEMRSDDGVLAMATGGGIDHMPDQWTTFVDGLVVEDESGRTLEVEHLGPVGWRVLRGGEGRLRVRYEVDLSFTAERWPPGNEQAGLVTQEALYVVTKPLFVTPPSPGARTVAFDVPDDWRISTPWERLESPRSFRATGLEDLSDNSIVIGRHTEHTFDEGPFSLTLALLGPLAASSELLGETLGSAVRHAVGVFPRTPRSRFLMTVFLADLDDGESFENSATFTLARPPRRDGIMLWGNNLAHELYHLWIGGRIRGTNSDDHEWFDEGFTDYYADLALVHSGLIADDLFWRKAEKVIGRYTYSKFSSLYPPHSLAEASSDKGRYRFAVYDGGWTAAFCLDTRILAASNGERSLDDVMGLLYRRFAEPSRAFSLAGLEAAAIEASEADLQDFFTRHVHGREPIPARDCLVAAGMDGQFQPYAGELWISRLEGLTEKQRRVRRAIVEGR